MIGTDDAPRAARLFEIQLALDPKLFNTLAQGGSSDTQDLCGMDLVAIGFFKRLDDQLTFHRWNDFQLRLAPGPLK